MDFAAIRNAAEAYKPAMVKFLRDMIAIPSESCEEEGVVKRIAEELKALGYDKVEFDKLGNVIGWMRATRSSPSTATSILLASAISKTGKPTPTRAMRPMTSSTAAAVPTRRVAWPPPPTA